MKSSEWTTLAVSGLILYIIMAKRKKIITYVETKVWDYITDTRIETLHPKIRSKAREFINRAEAQGIKLRITSAYRTYEEQAKLYAQGRTAPGPIVTQAKAGESSHNFATAFDVVPIVNGVAVYDGDWTKIATIGKSLGFAWGGDWKSFKDKPHFEMNFGLTLAQLRLLVANGQTENGYVIV